MFSVKDLEVYKDSLKEKKIGTSRQTDRPPSQTPTSVAKVSKPPLKLSNEESLKERKPLSVVHKASNTIRDPHKPLSSASDVPIKQAQSWKKNKDAPLKSPPAPLVKSSEFKTDTRRSPKDVVPSKSPTINSDKNVTVACKQSTHTPAYQKVPSLSGNKAAPTVDVNPSLCSECVKSQSEGAVCFIGNDGRVSACTSRAAVRLCKNLNCAANNPNYVAAMANAPKKFLVSKRHMVRAQSCPKMKNGGLKLPNVYQTDAVENGGFASFTSPVVKSSPLDVKNADNWPLESRDVDLKLLDSLSPFDEETSLLDRNLSIELDDISSQSSNLSNNLGRAQDVVIDDHTGFSFHNAERAEPISPILFVVSSKDHIEASAGDTSSFHEDAESLATENFEEHYDDMDGNPMHSDSKAGELSTTYGNSISSEEADIEDESGDLIFRSLIENEGFNPALTRDVIKPSTSIICESVKSKEQVDELPTAVGGQDAGLHHQSVPLRMPGVEGALDEMMPILGRNEVTNDCIGDLNADPIKRTVHDMQIDDFASEIFTDPAHGNSQEGDNADSIPKHSDCALMLISMADRKGDILPPLDEADGHTCKVAHLGENADNGEGSITSTLVAESRLSNDEDVSLVDEGAITSTLVAESTLSNEEDVSLVDEGVHAENEDQSDEYDSEDDGLDERLSGKPIADGNECNDAQANKQGATNGRDAKDPGNEMSNTQRQKRQRALRLQEEVRREMVILRKQQMQDRKQAEEWMLDHAIEGVVHKLAPRGDGKVKILVEAFERIISHGDDSTRQEDVELSMITSPTHRLGALQLS